MTNRNAQSPLRKLSDLLAPYTAELAENVLGRLMEGRTLLDVGRHEGMPAPQTVRQWVLDDREGFAARYFRARRIGYAAMADRAFDDAEHALETLMTCEPEDREHERRFVQDMEARCRLLAIFLPGIYEDQPAGKLDRRPKDQRTSRHRRTPLN